jgi:hypothetical protein
MEVLPEPEPEAESEMEEAEGVGKGVSLDSMRETSNRMKGGSPQRWDWRGDCSLTVRATP